MHPSPIEPGPGQESVWDYPRPPRCEPTSACITVLHNEVVIAETRQAIRVLETSQPPAFYLPRDDVNFEAIVSARAVSFCEWKGEATYFDLNPELTNSGTSMDKIGWTYVAPNRGFESIANHIAFYAQKLTCSVDDEEVDPNSGSFYGGWITSKVVGPFKGGPGSAWW